LCTKTAGANDIVIPFKNGLVYDRDTNLSFKNSFEKILKSWSTFSKNAIETFDNHYLLNAVDKHYQYIKKNCIR
jgi:hypothetical protein